MSDERALRNLLEDHLRQEPYAMTPDSLLARLPELRAVAEKATQGEWATDYRYGEASMVIVDDAGRLPLASTAPYPLAQNNTQRVEANAAHIATFDPQTCLALIALLEAITQEEPAVKKTMTQTLTPEEMAIMEGYLASKTPPPVADVDTRLKEAAVALAVATVASCDCDTKTPDPEFHKSDCTYASLRMAMARVDRIIGRRAARALTQKASHHED